MVTSAQHWLILVSWDILNGFDCCPNTAPSENIIHKSQKLVTIFKKELIYSYNVFFFLKIGTRSCRCLALLCRYCDYLDKVV